MNTAMPKKTNEHTHYANAARDFLKARRDELGGNKALYRELYGAEPTDNENQRLINLLNRGNLSAEFLGLCADRLKLGDTTLKQLFRTR
ncbi:hypothetical protein NFHSH190041_20140 [Shewanella sp. NFH-SH190041]|uniref:hypothetical protein n=1 Tax=Shewanella sp. NFH-SH190041 TaxID=2950245 RepID=UPI0021C25993|nr:hypothetical protein [Shewanella sp. NFH-SH190041]BDM64562.1 hypothetical protein NFHSH190041_20140 [Shewanella sp. NFH-SH190041]